MIKAHRILLTLVVLLLSVESAWVGAESIEHPKIIAGFGSSVCNGAGDHLEKGGYIGRLQTLMSERGWQVDNVSRGGDNTIRIQDRWEITDKPPSRPVESDRYLLPHKAGYVIIGLSLANEGLLKGTQEERDQIFEQFRTGMRGIIDRCRQEGMRVVVANCYPQNKYAAEHYDAIKRMNLLINTWDVPSINLLGTIDDGLGHWVDGFYRDDGHPSGGGHQEMFHAIVPTLFDAMAADKPLPKISRAKGYARVENSKYSAFKFSPEDTMHSFAISLQIRPSEGSVIAEISGVTGMLETGELKFRETTRKTHRISKGSQAAVTLAVKDNKLIYTSTSGKRVIGNTKLTDGQWHHVTLSHRCAQGETLIFEDGKLVSTIEERFLPAKFELGVTSKIDMRDLFVYRSALTEDEVTSLNEGKMIQSSLEVYAPLREDSFINKNSVENRAQSFSKVFVSNNKVVSIQSNAE